MDYEKIDSGSSLRFARNDEIQAVPLTPIFPGGSEDGFQHGVEAVGAGG